MWRQELDSEHPFQLGAFCDSTQYWPQGWLPVAASRGKQLSKTHFTFYRAGCRAALVSLRYSQQQRQTLPHSYGPTPSRPACLPPNGTAEQGPRAARSYRAAPAPQPPRSDPASEKDGSAQRRSPPPHRSRGPRPSSVGAAATTSSKVAGRGRPQGRLPAGPSSPPLSTQRGAHPPGRARCPWRRGLAGARRGQAREPCAQGRSRGAAMTGGPAPAPIGRWRRKGRGEGVVPGCGRAQPEVGVPLLG